MSDDYSNIASFYDYAAGWSLMPVRHAAAELALQGGAKRVLDIGCGTGLQLVELEKLGIYAAGVDSSRAMLGVAEQRLEDFFKDNAGRPAAYLGETVCNRNNDAQFLTDGKPGDAGTSQFAHGRLVAASGSALPFADGSFDLAMLSLVLHESAEEPLALIDEALRVAPRVLILDWCMAERNLDYPVRLGVRLVERLAGSRHYAAYKNYMRRGALEGLVERYRREHSAHVAGRRHMFFNAILLMELERA